MNSKNGENDAVNDSNVSANLQSFAQKTPMLNKKAAS
jgi:hypothetical protein